MKNEKFVCKYCNRSFSREKTLLSHMCPKKRRVADKNTIGSRLGFRVYQRFYQMTTNAKKPKTFDDFINSQYYVDFVKFGRYLADFDPLYINEYVDFVIQNGVKLKEWNKEYVFDTFIDIFLRKENPMSAVERSIIFIDEWCKKNNVKFEDFFSSIHPTELVFYLKRGKISPWVMYLSEKAGIALSNLNEEHYGLIENVMNPGVWKSRLLKNPDDVKFFRKILEEAKL